MAKPKDDSSTKRAAATEIDQVARNKVWRERCLREDRNLQLQDRFTVGRLEDVQVLTPKLTATTPLNPELADADVQKALSELQAVCQLKFGAKQAAAQEGLPATANGAYGAAPSTLLATHPLFDHRKAACDATQFASAYAASTGGLSPFARKQSAQTTEGSKPG